MNEAVDIPSGHDSADGGERFLVFKYGKRECLIQAGEVSEIIGSLAVSRVPGASRAIRGIAVHRGDILTVIDLAQILPQEFRHTEPATKLLVLRGETEGSKLAIAIGEACGFADPPELSQGNGTAPPLVLRRSQIQELITPAIVT
jgi:chemotaxis signal transduction protein